MATKHSLTSRTEKCCPQCGQEFILAARKEVLAIQPTQVDLICSGCHFPGRAVVTEMNQIQSVYPSPDAASPIGVALDSAGWLTANRFYSLPSGLAT